MPYPHQDEAVYGAMLPQPALRFLLADEPGTGKTVMAGLYIREMQRAGRLRRVLLAVPAHLVPKWERDLHRFFGIEPARVTSEMAKRPERLHPDRDVWVVSVDLLARNRQAQQKVVFEPGPWDLVVFDEAHRLTPTAQTAFPVALELSRRCTHLLLLTATPHRGNEYLFRALLHLLDPDLYPWSEDDERRLQGADVRLRPAPMHFLRRMKEDLRGYDGVTPLFMPRKAYNEPVGLGAREQELYDAALGYCERHLDDRTGLASSIYGKRGGSSLHALSETLGRRAERVEAFASRRGTGPAEVAPLVSVAQYEEGDEEERGALEDLVDAAPSRDPRAELTENEALRQRIRDLLADRSFVPAKLAALRERILQEHAIRPGTVEQLLLFTEFTDTARWLAGLLRSEGYTVEVYAGGVPAEERDRIQQRFLNREFQVLVSTDAGNEGIDLQSAHVQVNWDIPWSIVRLEQRMGRLHRIGQRSPVHLYNLVAATTREGRVQEVVLDRIVTAANALNGKLFDSLGSVLERLGLNYAAIMQRAASGDLTAEADARVIAGDDLRVEAEQLARADRLLATRSDPTSAGERLTGDALEAINPAIVGAALRAFAAAGGWDVREPHVDVLQVEAGRGAALPGCLGGGTRAVVALSGTALSKARAEGAALRGALVAGPAEPAFQNLVREAIDAGGDAIYAGAVLEDPGALTSYELQVHDASLVTVQGGAERVDPHPVLVRYDGSGARIVSWQTVANLHVPDGPGAGDFAPGPLRQGDAAARTTLEERASRIRQAIGDRVSRDIAQLDELETRIVGSLTGLHTDERLERARSIRAAFRDRRQDLTRAVEVRYEGQRFAGRVLVVPGRPGGDLEANQEAEVERIAMRVCFEELSRDYEVQDVHQDGVGYDLLARRRSDLRDVRCVEVKGKGDGLGDGIFLEASEWLEASQRDTAYWIYVVVYCASRPKVFARLRDPVALFDHSHRLVQRYLIPASALRRAVETA